MTSKLAGHSTMSNKALCVGFPNIGNDMDPFLVECYKESIKESKETLTNLVLESQKSIPIEDLLMEKSELFWRNYRCICL